MQADPARSVRLPAPSNLPAVTDGRVQQTRGWAWCDRGAHPEAPLSPPPSHDWIDGDKIPAPGAASWSLNHVSHVDPLTAAHIVYDHGRLPRYLAKSGLFTNKALGYFLRSAGQIPVERLSAQRRRGLRRRRGRLRAAMRRGLPRGHDHPRPGRLADERQVRCRPDRPGDRLPGDPRGAVGRAGDPRRRTRRGPTCFPARRMHLKVGDSGRARATWSPRTHTAAVVAEATERIMAAITALVAEHPRRDGPAEPVRPRQAGIPRSATPIKQRRRTPA